MARSYEWEQTEICIVCPKCNMETHLEARRSPTGRPADELRIAEHTNGDPIEIPQPKCGDSHRRMQLIPQR